MRGPVNDVSEGEPERTRTGWTDHGGQVVGGSEEERVARLICVWSSALAIAYPRIACSTALLAVLPRRLSALDPLFYSRQSIHHSEHV